MADLPSVLLRWQMMNNQWIYAGKLQSGLKIWPPRESRMAECSPMKNKKSVHSPLPDRQKVCIIRLSIGYTQRFNNET
jgi:hypothetical protein